MTRKGYIDYLKRRDHALLQARHAKRNLVDPLRRAAVLYYVALARADHLKHLREKREFSWYGGKVDETTVREIVRLKRRRRCLVRIPRHR